MAKPPAKVDVSSGHPMDFSRVAKKHIEAAFERIGGLDRLTEEADKDPKWFLEKLWTKNIQPEKIEISRERTVAEMLAELDSQMINVTRQPIEAAVEGRVEDGEQEPSSE